MEEITRHEDEGVRALLPLFDTNQLLTYTQAAEFLKVGVRTLKKWKSEGTIPHVVIGVDGVRFRVSSLNRWIDEREVS